ncbi:MAG: hypothetical protein WCW64_00700 [Phycisphaerae bacterium]|jgi:hypothetical protein
MKFIDRNFIAVPSSDLLSEIEQRLHRFSFVPNKQIIYGGDLGGDIAICLMDKVFGCECYTIYATILPCYPHQLKEHIFKKIYGRKNVKILNCGEQCVINTESNIVISGACSAIIEQIRNNEHGFNLEICGCFHLPNALSCFLQWNVDRYGENEKYRINNWWSYRNFGNGIQKICLYLFEGLNPRICELLALKTIASDDSFQWWRIHVCENKEYIDKCMYDLRELWKKEGQTKIINNILKLERGNNGWRL